MPEKDCRRSQPVTFIPTFIIINIIIINLLAQIMTKYHVQQNKASRTVRTLPIA